MKNQPEKKKPYNKWIALINIPVQMGIIIFLFSFLGKYLDENHPHQKIDYTKLLVIFGVFVAMYNVYRQVNQINKNE